MRKQFLLALSLACFMSLVAKVQAATIDVYVPAETKPGQVFPVQVYLNTEGEQTVGTDLLFKLDGEQLEFIKAESTDFYPHYHPVKQDFTKGLLRYSGTADYEQYQQGAGVFANLFFKRLGAGAAQAGQTGPAQAGQGQVGQGQAQQGQTGDNREQHPSGQTKTETEVDETGAGLSLDLIWQGERTDDTNVVGIDGQDLLTKRPKIIPVDLADFPQPVATASAQIARDQALGQADYGQVLGQEKQKSGLVKNSWLPAQWRPLLPWLLLLLIALLLWLYHKRQEWKAKYRR
jgi:hypothetical protein